MKIVSWNVNGIVACRRKGFLRFLSDTKPDIVCCQEIKTQCPLNTPGYEQFWNPSQEPGKSGTLILAKQPPLSWTIGFGIDKFDCEGRLITLEYKDYYIVNVYVPSIHPHNAPDRPDFRLEWDTALREYIVKLSKPVVLCGDLNATRAYIDSYPDNGKNEPDTPFFRSEVREGLEKLISVGLVDAFRVLNPNKEGSYTWWGPKNKNRAKNRGSRLDYFLLSGELLSFVQSIKFHKEILASDHCPISMLFYPVKPKREMDDDDMTAVWRSIDWERLEDILSSMQQDLSYQDRLRLAIDTALAERPADLDEFLALMKRAGYEVKKVRGGGISFRLTGQGQERFTRLRASTLGDGYDLQDVLAAIEGKEKRPGHSERKISLAVDIQAKLAAGKGPGYERWAKVFNIKQMAAALAYIQDNGLTDYEQLAQKATEAADRFHAISEQIKQTEQAMKTNAGLKAATVQYAKTRPVFEQYKATKYSRKFLAEHEADLELYRVAQAEMRSLLGGAKLPKMDVLKEEGRKLTAKKKQLYGEYQKARRDMQEIVTIKANIDTLMGYTEPGRKQEKER